MTEYYKKQLGLRVNNLKMIRQDYHITQKRIADRMGLTQSAVSQFECGKIDSYIMIIHYEDCLRHLIEEIE